MNFCIRSTPRTACNAAAHRRTARWPFCLDEESAAAGRGFGCSLSKTPQDCLDPQIALHDLGVVGVVKLQRLSESKDVLLTPVSGQCGGDLGLEAWQRRSRWVARTAGSRSPATTARMIHIGFARHIGHHVMELDFICISAFCICWMCDAL